MLRIVAIVCVLLLFVSCNGGGKSQMLTDGGINLGTGTAFGNSWNSHCNTYNFDTNVNITPFTTLGEMYNGSSFIFDIALMNTMISTDLGEASGLEGAGSNALYIWYDDEDHD